MTNRLHEPTPQRIAREEGPPDRSRREVDRSVRRAGLVAGTGLLLMSALAVVAQVAVLQGLVTAGGATGTAADIRSSDGLFRLGVASLLLVVVLDVVVAWALFRVFDPVSRGLSTLAAWFRLAYAAVFMVAIGQLAGIPELLGGEPYLAVFTADELDAQARLRVDAFEDLWDAGLLLFGVHLLVLGVLAYRSGYVPRILGVLLGVAGLGYLVDSAAAVLALGLTIDVATVTFVGEFLLALWLVVRGRHITVSGHGY